jgi:cytochrome P450
VAGRQPIDGSRPRILQNRTALDDYAEILEVLKSPAFVMVRGKEPPSSRELMNLTVATLDGPEHLRRRRIESSVFRNDTLAYFEQQALRPIMRASLAALIAPDLAGEPVEADLVPLMTELLHKVGAAVTGLDDVDSPERALQLQQLIAAIGPGITVEWVREGENEILQRARAAMSELERDFIRDSAARRRDLVDRHRAGELTREDLPRDVLTMLLLNWEDSWDEALPVREISIFLLASTQTTARLGPHVIQHLWEWRAAGGEVPLDPNFLGAAAAETLRLHVATVAMLRQATAEVVLQSGRIVQPGEVVVLQFDRANRDPRWFGDDAEQFNPARPALLEPPAMPWGLSFGGGAHMCIGRRMVTGGDLLGAHSDGAGHGTKGSLLTILATLLACGIEPDPSKSAHKNADTFYDFYNTYPVVFRNLTPESVAAIGTSSAG